MLLWRGLTMSWGRIRRSRMKWIWKTERNKMKYNFVCVFVCLFVPIIAVVFARKITGLYACFECIGECYWWQSDILKDSQGVRPTNRQNKVTGNTYMNLIFWLKCLQKRSDLPVTGLVIIFISNSVSIRVFGFETDSLPYHFSCCDLHHHPLHPHSLTEPLRESVSPLIHVFLFLVCNSSNQNRQSLITKMLKTFMKKI